MLNNDLIVPNIRQMINQLISMSILNILGLTVATRNPETCFYTAAIYYETN